MALRKALVLSLGYCKNDTIAPVKLINLSDHPTMISAKEN
jgi:hypothetical protein